MVSFRSRPELFSALLLQSKKSGRTSAVARGKAAPAIKAKPKGVGMHSARPRHGEELQAPRDPKGGGRPCLGGAKLDLSRAEDQIVEGAR